MTLTATIIAALVKCSGRRDCVWETTPQACSSEYCVLEQYAAKCQERPHRCLYPLPRAPKWTVVTSATANRLETGQTEAQQRKTGLPGPTHGAASSSGKANSPRRARRPRGTLRRQPRNNSS
eukprot:9478331-Pyramimonas_sp.AAC.1